MCEAILTTNFQSSKNNWGNSVVKTLIIHFSICRSPVTWRKVKFRTLRFKVKEQFLFFQVHVFFSKVNVMSVLSGIVLIYTHIALEKARVVLLVVGVPFFNLSSNCIYRGSKVSLCYTNALYLCLSMDIM